MHATLLTCNGSREQKVASVLLCRGRMPLAYIIRFSGLKPRTVRAAILVLVQHNVLWHAQSDDEGEVLEINIDECLTRLRFGRYVWQAEQLFGKAVRRFRFRAVSEKIISAGQAAEIVQLILDNGKLRPPDIISRLAIYDPVKGES